MAFERDLSNLNRSITLDRKGVDALIKRLSELPEKFQKSAHRATLRAGANVILKAARARVPVDTGILKKSLGVNVEVSRYGGSARVGPRYGVKYKYKNGNKTGRRGKSAGKAIDAPEVAFYIETGTPNMAAQPFIRPAIDETQGRVLSVMAEGLDKHLTRVVARLKR